MGRPADLKLNWTSLVSGMGERPPDQVIVSTFLRRHRPRQERLLTSFTVDTRSLAAMIDEGNQEEYKSCPMRLRPDNLRKRWSITLVWARVPLAGARGRPFPAARFQSPESESAWVDRTGSRIEYWTR